MKVAHRGGEKYSYFACILRVEPMIFVDILKVHYEERPMVSVQEVHATERMWVNYWDGREHEEEQVWCKKDSVWDMVRLKMLSKNLDNLSVFQK